MDEQTKESYSYDGQHLKCNDCGCLTSIKRHIAHNGDCPHSQGWSCLTEREKQIAVKIRQGKTIKEIATDYNLSAKTAEVHKHNLMRKLGVHKAVFVAELVIRREMAGESLT